MSLGYCQVSTVSLDPSANDRQLIDSGLPSMIKLVGFSLGMTRGAYEAVVGTVERFKLFDGTSVADPFWTIALPIPTISSMTAQPSVFIVTDDSYLDIRDGLSYEVTTTGLSSSDEPFLVNIFYIG